MLDSMKDHLIPHLYEKMMDKDMFDSHVGLFQRKNMDIKMVLRNNLISMQIPRSDDVSIYLMRIT